MAAQTTDASHAQALHDLMFMSSNQKLDDKQLQSELRSWLREHPSREWYMTAIATLILHKRYEIVKDYVKQDGHKILTEKKRENGDPLVFDFVKQMDTVVLEYFIKQLPIEDVNNLHDSANRTLLHAAIAYGQIDHINTLLMCGADQNLVPNKQGVISRIATPTGLGQIVLKRMAQHSFDFDRLAEVGTHEDFSVSFIGILPNASQLEFPWNPSKELPGDGGIITWQNSKEKIEEIGPVISWHKAIEELQEGWTSWYLKPDYVLPFLGATWIHIPSTNGVLVTAIMDRIQKLLMKKPGHGGQIKLIDVFLKDFQTISPSISTLAYTQPQHKHESVGEADHNVEFKHVAFPCLILDTIGNHDTKVSNQRKLRNSLPFGGQDIHCERTLHEAHYPELKPQVLKTLDEGQVVSEAFAEEIEHKGRPILLVPQLWLWQVQDFTISAFSFTRNSSFFARDDSRSMDYWDLRGEIFSPHLRIAWLLAEQIEFFGKSSADEVFPPVLVIFESAVYTILSEVTAYRPTSASELNIDEEIKFFRQISQIKNEIAMIKDVLQRQQVLLKAVGSSWKSNEEFARKEEVEMFRTKVHEAREMLDSYIERCDKIDFDAARIGQTTQDLLELKRTFATIRDARSSLLLGVAVAGFTVITVIFTPLAFVASLFALSVDQFVKNQYEIVNATDPTDKARVYPSSYLRRWFTVAEVVSLSVTTIVVIIALRFGGAFSFTEIGRKFSRLSGWDERSTRTSKTGITNVPKKEDKLSYIQRLSEKPSETVNDIEKQKEP